MEFTATELTTIQNALRVAAGRLAEQADKLAAGGPGCQRLSDQYTQQAQDALALLGKMAQEG